MNEIKNWPTEAAIKEAIDKDCFQVPYDGTNKFYSDDRIEGWKAAISWLKSQLQPIEGEGRTYTEGDVDDMIYNAFSAGFYTPIGAKFQPSIDKYIDDLKQKP